jgi:mRNA (guanine-N7-)-methyltransferase
MNSLLVDSGIDVARGSLTDAAVRIRDMRKRKKLSKTKATLVCADLGADVPGRKKSPSHINMQKLLAWSLQDETDYETATPEFKMIRGGGVSEKERFDVVSVQFAIHYMMSTGKRARRFFHTVSELLDIGGNLICTTIDARVVVGHLMNLGLDLHFDGNDKQFDKAVVEAGAGACKITFEPDIVKRIIKSKAGGAKGEEDLFGLQYTFTLVEGSDHKAGVGDAVNLPEWLTPIPILESLGKEAGLELEYAENFHEFYENRHMNPSARNALYNMKVLNRDGSLSADEWSISRLYAAIRFKKVRESTINLEEEEEEQNHDESDDEEEKTPTVELDPIKAKKMLPMAMMKAKKIAGEDKWKSLSSDEKKRWTQIELEKIAAK